MKFEGQLPCLQEPATGPFPEPDESNPHPHIRSRSVLIFSSNLCLGVLAGAKCDIFLKDNC